MAARHQLNLDDQRRGVIRKAFDGCWVIAHPSFPALTWDGQEWSFDDYSFYFDDVGRAIHYVRRIGMAALIELKDESWL